MAPTLPFLSALAPAQAPPDLGPFAFRLFHAAAAKEGNACLSPWSLAIALGMVRAGAAGDTAEQIDALLGLDGPQAWRKLAELKAAVAAGKLRTGPNAGDEVDAYEIAVANAAWVRSEFRLQPQFVATLADLFGAPPRDLDFTKPDARTTINRWVAEQTRDKIPELFGPGRPAADSRLVLVNCVYLNAPWVTPFPAAATRPRPFHLDRERSVEVATMHRTDHFGYARTEHAHLVDLPFRGGTLGLLLIVPHEVDGADRALGDLAERWPLRELGGERVALALPRCTLAPDYDLGPALQQMGMRDAFDPDRADLSPMTGGKDLYVTAVVQKTFVRIDEHSTEAAAASSATLGPTAAVRPPSEPIVVHADRPFAFAIHHRPSGAILFLGRIADPRG